MVEVARFAFSSCLFLCREVLEQNPRSPSISDDLYQHPLPPPAVELSAKDLLPGAKDFEELSRVVEAPGSVDVLDEGGGILVPPREADFANAVLELLSSEPRRRAMSKEAMTTAQRYSIPAATERLLSVYRTAIVIDPRVRKQGPCGLGE